MKRFGLFLILVIAACAINAQVSTQNYIRTRRMLNGAGYSYLDAIAYYDGLGRPFQLLKKAVKSGAQVGYNVGTLQEYDALGRESNTWLPITASADYVAFSVFKSSAPGNYGNDSRPYSQPLYETSPLNRVVEQYGPGDAWGTHPARTEYLLNNTSSLSCINYSVNSSDALEKVGNYAAGQLSVVKVSDEDGNIAYSFTDKLGRTLLERRMKGTEANDIYYVYDASGNLRFVLQPMYQRDANLDLYAFQYKYNGHDCCIWKKLPGAEYVEYTYNVADLLTFSQDGNQRVSGKYIYYKYDALRRVTEQGECTGKNAASSPVIHVVNHYDTYEFIGRGGFSPTIYTVGDTNGVGHLTGSEVYVPGWNNRIYTSYYYDIKGHETKRVSNELPGGMETVSTSYTFSGNVQTVTYNRTDKPKLAEAYTYTYDPSDRLSKVEHTLNGTKVSLSDKVYDNIGRLVVDSLHGSTANKLTYAYNLRGWLMSISSAPFKQNLYYTDGSNSMKCYNGNISSMTWQGRDGVTRGYKFSYDGLSRLVNAAYGETSSISANLDRFTEKITGYDKNGNITGLQRYGQTSASAYGLMDNLTFDLTGNQLNWVNDAVSVSAYNSGFDFKDGVKQAGEYAYDANGNLTKDLNKGISSIQYNVLNLPNIVTFIDGSTITNTYAMDGRKLRTIHKIGSTTTTTDYCDNVVYENGVAKLLLTGYGYVSLSDNKYHYYLQDHQGNNRAVINQTGAVEEASHYYPFGGTFANSTSVQPYKYNGKELDTKKGLNWYDYGARRYDAAVGRFTVVDPLAEKYYSISSYTYCLNNPIRFVDTDGRKVVDAQGHVIYSKNVGWSEGASPDAIRIGNAMMQTRMGAIQFDKMVDVDYGITLNISQETKIIKTDKNNTYLLGQAKKKVNTDKNVESVDIIIYEGTLNKFLKATSRKAKRYRVSTKDNDEAIGAVAAHESVHGTDKENIEESIENKTEGTLHNVEEKPNEVENEVLRELFNINNRLH